MELRYSVSHQPRIFSRSWAAALAAAAALFLFSLSAAPALAAYEQPPGPEGVFAGTLGPPPAEFGEEVQLGGVGGMAVNQSGAGGVPPGTVYAATRIGGESYVAVFAPKEEAGKERLAFLERWRVPATPKLIERCGPLVGTSCEPHVEESVRAVDVDIDQTTGNVYVFYGQASLPGTPKIVEYDASGAEEIARFGKQAPSGKTTAETPAEIHESPYPGGIAVDAAGTVYVFDLNASDNSYHRLMVFRPKTPGDFSEYEYAAGSDVGAGFQGNYPALPAVDAAGYVYVAGPGGNYVEEYDPSQPKAAPICSFEFAQGGITALAVNPASGEPFFFSSKKVGGVKAVHRLSACQGGKFTEVEAIAVAPERDDLYGLAYDPVREFSLGRGPGALYGGAPRPVPDVGKGEPGQSSLGYLFVPTEERPPVIEAESVSAVVATTAQLNAVIDPAGLPTRYAFQYITDAAYQANPPGERFNGALETPPGGAPLGEGGAPIAAAAAIGALLPDTEYHYRAIATNCPAKAAAASCEAAGGEQSFRTYPVSAAGLPDGRAYELVSPSQKSGGQVLPADSRAGHGTCGQPECKPGNGYTRFPLQSSPEGNAIVYEGTPFAPAGGAAIENQYIAPRNPAAGWQTANLTPPLLLSKGGGGYKAFDPTLGLGLLQQIAPVLSAGSPAGYPNLYLQSAANPLDLQELLSQAPPNRQPGNGSERLELTYAGASTDLSRVFFEANDALSGATPFAPEASGGAAGEVNLYEWSGGQLRLINVAPGNALTLPEAEFGSANVVSHAISADGSHVFWSNEAEQLYVRIDAQETVKVKDPGKFLTASADGSRVLLDDGCLYLLATEECDDLSGGKGGFQGLAGQSEDLSHLYFVDTAVLTEVANQGGEKAQATKNNLYSWSEGETAFIATLLPEDNSLATGGGDWQRSPSSRSAAASPAGRWLAFISSARLSGYDNTGLCKVVNSGTGELGPGPCAEVFLYDSATGELRCPSCSPTNAAPLGYSELSQIEGATSALPQPRYLIDSGRLYFNSRDSLSPADTNGGAEDVYQFEPLGTGSCGREGGCVSLISSGGKATDSNLLAIDQSAQNVFFTTRERLLPIDQDGLIDLYDARVGGGFAAESQAPPSECKGEACQPSPPVPAELSPSSSSGSAKAPKKCKKGQVKRHGKCMKKPQHKGKKHNGRAHRQERGAPR